jgi:hypothetical protein
MKPVSLVCRSRHAAALARLWPALLAVSLVAGGGPGRPARRVGSPAGTEADFFVATNGNDSWSGTLPGPNSTNTDGPFASVAKAQLALRALIRTNPKHPPAVMLRGGTYYLALSATAPGTLMFTASDSGTANMPVAWENYPGETPIVNGGAPVGKGGLDLTWTNAGNNLWQVKLPTATQPFEYLFYNGERRLRSRLESSTGTGYYMHGGACYSTVTKQVVANSFCNLGTFLRVAASIPPTGANAGCPSVIDGEDATQSKCLDRFTYNPADPIGEWVNLNPSGSLCGGASNAYPVGDVEIAFFEAWSMEMMRVSCVDTVNHVIYFTAATRDSSNVYNYFGPTKGHRYIVENTKDAFSAAQSAGQTGLWFLDRSTSPWTLNYLANAGENPNSDTIVIPQLQPVSSPGNPGGTLLSATNLNYAAFRGITFEMDNYVPPPAGFNDDDNEDLGLPQAIDCESCQYATFDGITVRHTSASGILIASTSGNSGTPAENDLIENSAFYDIGDSGIRIGHQFSGSDKWANVVQSVTAKNNIVQGYSRVFADGEGIAQGNGHDITYTHNDITDGYHAGISICNATCYSVKTNGNNTVSEYNHIWNTLQGITSDGGTLYYNVGGPGGSGTGNFILNNLVHDTTDSSIIDAGVPAGGYGGHGIYLDAQSAGIDVENNVVYNVSASAAFMSEGPAPGQPAHTWRNNILAYARRSMFEEQDAWPQGCTSPSMRASIANNIFYFDLDDATGFYPMQGCAYSCGLDYDKFQNFQGNLYWRTDGKFASYGKGFHVLTTAPSDATTCGSATSTKVWTFLTFSQWQGGQPPNGIPPAMDEDQTGTVTANPGFGKTGKPTDFLLSVNPVPGFDYTKTNDTILHAGRSTSVIMPPEVPATFPTYKFTSF